MYTAPISGTGSRSPAWAGRSLALLLPDAFPAIGVADSAAAERGANTNNKNTIQRSDVGWPPHVRGLDLMVWEATDLRKRETKNQKQHDAKKRSIRTVSLAWRPLGPRNVMAWAGLSRSKGRGNCCGPIGAKISCYSRNGLVKPAPNLGSSLALIPCAFASSAQTRRSAEGRIDAVNLATAKSLTAGRHRVGLLRVYGRWARHRAGGFYVNSLVQMDFHDGRENLQVRPGRCDAPGLALETREDRYEK